MSQDAPVKGRLLYPTAYLAREGELMEAKTALSRLFEVTPTPACRYSEFDDTAVQEKERTLSLHAPVRKTVHYRRAYKKRWARR